MDLDLDLEIELDMKTNPIIPILKELKIPENMLREYYSGRFMFAKTCPGIYCDDLKEFREVVNKLTTKNLSYSSDNLGHGYIIYFPLCPN